MGKILAAIAALLLLSAGCSSSSDSKVGGDPKGFAKITLHDIGSGSMGEKEILVQCDSEPKMCSKILRWQKINDELAARTLIGCASVDIAGVIDRKKISIQADCNVEKFYDSIVRELKKNYAIPTAGTTATS